MHARRKGERLASSSSPVVGMRMRSHVSTELLEEPFDPDVAGTATIGKPPFNGADSSGD